MTTQTHTPHKQVPAKVNRFVDEDIKDLVEALNNLDGRLWTFESCQGLNGQPAVVSMRFGRIGEYDSAEVARFTDSLVGMIRLEMDRESLASSEGDLAPSGYDTRVTLEWCGDKQHPFITIEIPHNELNTITRIFNESASCRTNRHPLGHSEVADES